MHYALCTKKGLSHLDEDAVFFVRQAYIDTSRAKKRREKNNNSQPIILYWNEEEAFSPNNSGETAPSYSILFGLR
jgi:hypothetical protein